MSEITKDEFLQMVRDLAEENWIVKKMYDAFKEYDNFPPNIKKLIDDKLGITRIEKIIIKQ
jgi:hypothetical protein